MRDQRIAKPAIVLFEDGGYEDLHPLTRLRPAFDLRCGAYSLRERLSAVGCWLLAERRPVAEASGIDPVTMSALKPPVILLNGRGRLSDKDLQLFAKAKADTAWVEGQTFVAIKIVSDELAGKLKRCDRPTAENLQLLVKSCQQEQVQGKLYRYLWDLVNDNGDAIARDFSRFKDSGYKQHKGTHLIGTRGRLKVCKGAAIAPGVILDTTQGPIIIDQNARIRPLTFIEGPCYIGNNALVDGAKLRPGCSIGAHCKVAGEVEESVMLDYANKHHDGFLGHAYVGSWANLGAGTCNSDLKNNYGTIAVRIGNRTVDSGSIKVGCFIGDHSKTAIGTMINTGAVIGVGCNVHGGAVRKELPDFSWGHSERFTGHAPAKMLATAEAAMARRHCSLTAPQRQLLLRIAERVNAAKEGGS